MATFISNSPAETQAIGRQLATTIVAGSVLALTGELGSGKTQFVKGIVAGMGSGDPVTSPTFTILHEYRGGRLPVYHFDFFRLQDRKSIASVGLDEYLFGDGVSVIEWADRFPDLVPGNTQWISLGVRSENERTITVEAGHIRDTDITPNSLVRHEGARA
jgi:tRNA threonylcarbamoyladenosine biosynthesis protein TsaE